MPVPAPFDSLKKSNLLRNLASGGWTSPFPAPLVSSGTRGGSQILQAKTKNRRRLDNNNLFIDLAYFFKQENLLMAAW